MRGRYDCLSGFAILGADLDAGTGVSPCAVPAAIPRPTPPHGSERPAIVQAGDEPRSTILISLLIHKKKSRLDEPGRFTC
jgi:hypothetical protein